MAPSKRGIKRKALHNLFPMIPGISRMPSTREESSSTHSQSSEGIPETEPQFIGQIVPPADPDETQAPSQPLQSSDDEGETPQNHQQPPDQDQLQDLPDYRKEGYYLPDPDKRLMIAPEGHSFLPSKPSTKIISRVIKEKYNKAYKNWKDVRLNDEGIMWKFFSSLCAWEEKYDNQIKGVFDKCASKRLSELLGKAREAGERPYWIGEALWPQLLIHWETDEFKKISNINKRNRASEKGGSLHTGGSISTAQHLYNMEKERGGPVPLHELHRRLHTRKSNGEFVDERARKTQQNFQAAMADFEHQSHASGIEVTPDVMKEVELKKWTEAAGGFKKNRLYGSGTLAPYFKSTTSISPSYRSTVNSLQDLAEIKTLKEENEQLKSKFAQLETKHEEFTQKMNDKVATMMAMMMQQQNVRQIQPPFPDRYHQAPQSEFHSQHRQTRQLQFPPQYQIHSQHPQMPSFVESRGIPHLYHSTDHPQSHGRSHQFSPSHIIDNPSGNTSYDTPSGSGSRHYQEHSLSTPERDAAASAAQMPNDMDFINAMGVDFQLGYRPRMPEPD